MPYAYLDGIATADIAFRAWDATLEGVFRAAAEATLGVMVEDLDTVRSRQVESLGLENESLEFLLFDFLNELVYLKDARLLLLRVTGVTIVRQGDRWRLEARAAGETLDPERHETRVDVKAVTLHRFALERTGEGWQATVVLDI